jgi:hypothetical protein
MMEETKTVIVVEKPRRAIWAERWGVMHKWWSVRVGAVGVLLMAGIPALSDQFPNIAPSLISYFPKHGQQWVPILGAVIAIAARVVSQGYVIDKLRSMFGHKDGGDGPH